MTEFYDLNGRMQDAALGWTRVIEPTIINSMNLQQDVRKARNSEIVFAEGGDKINRLASDCWELDAISSPEMHSEKDFMHQMNSGIDYVIVRACAEKGIAIEFCFSNVLKAHGRKRSQILARMMQNVRTCRETGCKMIITSGARGYYELRAARDLMAFGIILGMAPDEAKDALSSNPKAILKRSVDRHNPNIILKGLEVKKWGSPKREKKLYGWY
jgi:RNase P/RNase MRP subunit p30